MITNLSTTTGVYTDKATNAFSNSVAEVATVVPAFIGYTPYTSSEGKSNHMKPVKITSIADLNVFFSNSSTAKQYAPTYLLTKQKKAPVTGEYYLFHGDIYTIEPDPTTIYNLYNSVKLFFQRGGSVAYIVSVGQYKLPSHAALNSRKDINTTTVRLSDLQAGLDVLRKQDDVTLYVVPETTRLSRSDYITLLQRMLEQCSTMRRSMSMLNVKRDREPGAHLWLQNTQNFRNWAGNNGLSYGATYYPFLATTIFPIDQVDYTSINGGDVSVLLDVLNPTLAPNPTAAAILNSVKAGQVLTVSQKHRALLKASKIYSLILGIIQAKINTMPPNGIVVGI